ncbi:unnamed protein product [Cochlearia groenlandica]
MSISFSSSPSDSILEILSKPTKATRTLVAQVKRIMGTSGYTSEKVVDATNAIYILKDEHNEPIAIFKLDLGEKLENKEKDYKGDKSTREVAAFLLDIPMGDDEDGVSFCGVPTTTMVVIKDD